MIVFHFTRNILCYQRRKKKKKTRKILHKIPKKKKKNSYILSVLGKQKYFIQSFYLFILLFGTIEISYQQNSNDLVRIAKSRFYYA